MWREHNGVCCASQTEQDKAHILVFRRPFPAQFQTYRKTNSRTCSMVYLKFTNFGTIALQIRCSWYQPVPIKSIVDNLRTFVVRHRNKVDKRKSSFSFQLPAIGDDIDVTQQTGLVKNHSLLFFSSLQQCVAFQVDRGLSFCQFYNTCLCTAAVIIIDKVASQRVATFSLGCRILFPIIVVIAGWLGVWELEKSATRLRHVLYMTGTTYMLCELQCSAILLP